MRNVILLLTTLSAAVWLACGITEAPVAPETDRQFILSASNLHLLSLAAAQSALNRATAPPMAAFAQQVISENNAINRELITLAWQKSIQLKELSDSNTEKIDSLLRRPSPVFDYHFMDLIVNAYAELVTLYETETEWGRDLGVQSWAQTKLPALRENLRQAEAARQSL